MTAASTDQTSADAFGAAETTSDPQFDAALFGEPPLLAGEDPNQYMALFRRIATTVQPIDIFERQSVRHVTDLMWEARRYRRLITRLIDGNDQLGLEKVLQRLVPTAPLDLLMLGTTKAQDLARGYALKQETAVAQVDHLLTLAGLSWDTVKAEAAALRTGEIERLNRLVITASARVNSSLRELERRRAELAKRMRRAVQQVEAAEAVDLKTAESGQFGAAPIEPAKPRVVQQAQSADVEQMSATAVADSQADAADDRKLAA
jgi:hypothetical protein